MNSVYFCVCIVNSVYLCVVSRAVVKLLLDSGVDVNCSTQAGTALFEAALCGKVEVSEPSAL